MLNAQTLQILANKFNQKLFTKDIKNAEERSLGLSYQWSVVMDGVERKGLEELLIKMGESFGSVNICNRSKLLNCNYVWLQFN
jgi:hypothetical protein